MWRCALTSVTLDSARLSKASYTPKPRHPRGTVYGNMTAVKEVEKPVRRTNTGLASKEVYSVALHLVYLFCDPSLLFLCSSLVSLFSSVIIMATANLSAAFSSPQTQFKRCVGCNVLQPSDGRILNCIHLVCLTCLNDNIADGGCFKCCLCGEETAPFIKGVDLAKQLPMFTANESDDRMGGLMGGQMSPLQCGLCIEATDATHRCLECSGIGLCTAHAEKHPTAKPFTGHIVEELPDNNTQVRTTAESNNAPHVCPLHNKHQVSKYCQTCCHTVCERCVTVGHRSHIFESIESAADVQRRELQSMGCTESEEGAVKDGAFEQPLTRVSAKLDGVQRQKETVSSVIADVFDEAVKMLVTRKEELLAEVDSLAWRQMEPLELKKSKLASIADQHAFAVELSKRLVSGDSNPCNVLRLSRILIERLKKMKIEIGEACVLPVTSEIKTYALPLSQLSEIIQSLVRVSIHGVDMSKTAIDIPGRIVVNEEVTAKVKLLDSQNKPIPTSHPGLNVDAALFIPSGDRQSLATSAGGSACDPYLEVKFTPALPGQHRLEIHLDGQVAKTQFEVEILPAFQFNALKCSPLVTISDGGRVARHTGLERGTHGSVLFRNGYTTGRHQWCIHVKNGADNNYTMAVGVTVLPSDGRYDCEENFFSHRNYYIWWCNGPAQSRPNSARASSSPWKDGDMLTLTLDCDEGKLELHLRRTDEKVTFHGVKCYEPLYPAVNLCRRGQAVEIC